jgi:GABA(A) receptor-associated protein
MDKNNSNNLLTLFSNILPKSNLNPPELDFRDRFSFEQRSSECARIFSKFPGRIPVIVQRNNKNNNNETPKIDKEKFLVPGDLTLGQFVFVIRKRINLSPEKALFLFVGNTLPTTGSLMREIYHTHKDADGFLYAVYSGENSFGLNLY